MPIASCNSTASNIFSVIALKTISWYLPHNDTAQNLAIIQRDARTHNVQAHSLTLLYRGRARTIVHTARTLIFAFKIGVGWLQVWWAQAKKPSIFPLYTPLVDGGERTSDSLHRPEIGVPETLVSVTRLSTADDVSTPSYSSRPHTTTNKYALETYQPARSISSWSCCSGPQLIALFSICVIILVLIIIANSVPRNPKLNPTSTTTHPLRAAAKMDNEPEHATRPSATTTQSSDSDTEDTDGGGTRLPSAVEEVPIPAPRNRAVHAHHEVGEVASFPSRLRGGRRNVSVHWQREHMREVRRDELREKRKRMANEDWRVRAGD